MVFAELVPNALGKRMLNAMAIIAILAIAAANVNFYVARKITE